MRRCTKQSQNQLHQFNCRYGACKLAPSILVNSMQGDCDARAEHMFQVIASPSRECDVTQTTYVANMLASNQSSSILVHTTDGYRLDKLDCFLVLHPLHEIQNYVCIAKQMRSTGKAKSISRTKRHRCNIRQYLPAAVAHMLQFVYQLFSCVAQPV